MKYILRILFAYLQDKTLKKIYKYFKRNNQSLVLNLEKQHQFCYSDLETPIFTNRIKKNMMYKKTCLETKA